MSDPDSAQPSIPVGLRSYFQEYDLGSLHVERDANLIMQRTLEFGNWEEVRWLFQTYGKERIRAFLRKFGERMLKPSTFNYWRKLFGVRRWKHSPFPTSRREVWPY
jgi:hypothetical protein